jgi:hypothetical protein
MGSRESHRAKVSLWGSLEIDMYKARVAVTTLEPYRYVMQCLWEGS